MGDAWLQTRVSPHHVVAVHNHMKMRWPLCWRKMEPILMLATLKQDGHWRHHVYFADISMIPLSSHVILGVDLITLLGQCKLY